VTAIAAEAGVAAGGVHYHFASKAEILADLVDRLVERAHARIVSRSAAAPDARGRLLAILDALLVQDDGADPDAVAVWALIGAEAVRNEEVRDVYGEWIAMAREALRDAFSAARREQGRSAKGAAAAAAALIALVEGYYAVAAGAPGVIPAGSAASQARVVALALLADDRQGAAP
jgi:TetR/AcrR family transcriptional repressor of bet genes